MAAGIYRVTKNAAGCLNAQWFPDQHMNYPSRAERKYSDLGGHDHEWVYTTLEEFGFQRREGSKKIWEPIETGEIA